MTNQQVIEKVLEKAINNGYNYSFKYLGIKGLTDSKDRMLHAINSIIYSDDFAKAFWKGIYVGLEVHSIHHPDICKITEIIDERSVRTDWKNENLNGQLLYDLEYNTESWKKRLQEMVLEEEPLKYLEKFL